LGAADADRDREAVDVAEQVSFPAADAFAAVDADADADLFTGPEVAGGHRVGVEKSDGRFRISPGLAAAPAQQACHDQMPDAGVAPAAELLPHRRPRWKIALGGGATAHRS
jgi:hypothetical protein